MWCGVRVMCRCMCVVYVCTVWCVMCGVCGVCDMVCESYVCGVWCVCGV